VVVRLHTNPDSFRFSSHNLVPGGGAQPLFTVSTTRKTRDFINLRIKRKTKSPLAQCNSPKNFYSLNLVLLDFRQERLLRKSKATGRRPYCLALLPSYLLTSSFPNLPSLICWDPGRSDTINQQIAVTGSKEPICLRYPTSQNPNTTFYKTIPDHKSTDMYSPTRKRKAVHGNARLGLKPLCIPPKLYAVNEFSVKTLSPVQKIVFSHKIICSAICTGVFS
jgi:hypothetical protein